MNKKYYLFLLLFYQASFVFAQSTYIERAELGLSLFSLTKENQSDNIMRGYRNLYGGIFNGFIFKYHKEQYTFRIHLRIIGVQGTEMNSIDAPEFGDNYDDVGFQLGVGVEKKVAKNKRWEWYIGSELMLLKVKETDFYLGRDINNSFYYDYSMGAVNLISGIKLKASRHLSFIWEMNQVFGLLTRKDRFTNKQQWLVQGYFNPVGIFGATISWNKEK